MNNRRNKKAKRILRLNIKGLGSLTFDAYFMPLVDLSKDYTPGLWRGFLFHPMLFQTVKSADERLNIPTSRMVLSSENRK